MYEFFEYLLNLKGLTAAEVCKATGIGQPTISTWKSRNNVLNASQLLILAQYLDVPMEFLMTGKMVKRDYPSDSSIKLNNFEQDVVLSLRKQPEMADAICRLLGITPNHERHSAIS